MGGLIRLALTARIDTAFVFTAPLALGATDAERDEHRRAPPLIKITFTDCRDLLVTDGDGG
jgi:hypothetical protein